MSRSARRFRRSWKILSAVFSAGSAMFAAGGMAVAQTSQWVGGNSADWNTAGHWSPSGVPGNSDTVNVTSTLGVSQTITYDYPGATTINTLTLDLDGGNGIGSETITMSANTLSATLETIGYSGSGIQGDGTFNQSGGLNMVGDAGLSMGINPSDKGIYNLSGGTLSLPAGEENVGAGGTGIFNQSGGTNAAANLAISTNNDLMTASYTLSGNGSLAVTGAEVVGADGPGTFNQTGGTNTIASGGSFYIAYENNSSGIYSLSGGSLTVNGNAYIGGFSNVVGGPGTLTISFTGQMTVTGTLQVFAGQNALNLAEGSLTAGILDLNGAFNQFTWLQGTLDLTGAGGENITIDSTSAANFGDSAGSGSSFTLGIGQTLEVNGAENVGFNGTGSFTQTGGSNSCAGDLALGVNSGSTGSYTLSGSGSLSVTGSERVGFSGSGNFTQSGGLNTVANNLNLGFNSSGSGSYSLTGGTLNVGGNVNLGGQNSGIGGAGTLTVSNSGQMTVGGTLRLYPGSQNVLTLGGGSITASVLNLNSSYNQFVWTAGTLNLTGENITVDSSSAGNFGDSAGSASSFVLGAGQALVAGGNEFVGYNGTGTFNQNGGTNTLNGGGEFIVGNNSASTGTYILSGPAALSVIGGGEFVGDAGTGIFEQSGGMNTTTGSIFIGSSAGSSGTYLLSGGMASVGNSGFAGVYVGGTVVAAGGTGVLTVSSGGVLNAGTTLTVWGSPGSSVNLNGGIINAAALNINSGALFRGNQAGILNVSGMATISGTMSLDGEASFSAGTINVPSGGLLALNNASGSAATINISSGGQVQMDNSAASILYGNVSNAGLVIGAGQINGTFSNTAAGELNVNGGQVLTVTGASNVNVGLISLGGGILEFTQGLKNQGGAASIEGTGELRVNGGLTNSATMALAGPSSVFGNVTNSAAGLIHLSGTSANVFFGPVSNSGTLTIDAGASGTFYGAYTGTGAVNNFGSVYFNANSVSGKITGNGNLNVGSQGLPTTLQIQPISGTSAQSSLTINPGSTLDISNNTIAINYGSPVSDPVVTIPAYLANGYKGGTWTGTSTAAGVLTSSTAAAGTPGQTLSVGYADGNADAGTAAGPNQIVVKYTLAGDANLDGLVNFNDLVAVVQNFNKTNTDWAHGNFTYGATTNFNDLVAVVQNFNKTLMPAGSSSVQLGGATMPLVSATDVQLPEPSAITLAAMAAGGLLLRRRRKLSV